MTLLCDFCDEVWGFCEIMCKIGILNMNCAGHMSKLCKTWYVHVCCTCTGYVRVWHAAHAHVWEITLSMLEFSLQHTYFRTNSNKWVFGGYVVVWLCEICEFHDNGVKVWGWMWNMWISRIESLQIIANFDKIGILNIEFHYICKINCKVWGGNLDLVCKIYTNCVILV